MNNPDNEIRKAFRNIRLCDAKKNEIAVNCLTELYSPKKKSFKISKFVAVAAAAALIIAGATVSVIAFGKTKNSPAVNGVSPHINNAAENIVTVQDDRASVSADGKYVIKCNSVSGSDEEFVANMSIQKVDGGSVLELPENEKVQLVSFDHPHITLENGEDYPLFPLPLDTTFDNSFDYDFSALTYVSGKAEISIGNVRAMIYKDEPHSLAADNLGELLRQLPEGKVTVTDHDFYYVHDEDIPHYADVSTLEGGDKKVKLFADREIYLDNYAFAPYGEYREEIDGQYTALYLSVIPDTQLLNDIGEITFDSPTLKTSVKHEKNHLVIILYVRYEISKWSSTTRDITEEEVNNIKNVLIRKTEDVNLCTFDAPITIDADYKTSTVDKYIDPVTIHLDEGEIILDRIVMKNSSTTLFGTCNAEGILPDLNLSEAYVLLSDGSTVKLGHKNGCGTDESGNIFELHWLNDTFFDPDEVVEIHVNDAVIDLR